MQADWRGLKLDLRSGSQRHRHFVGYFNVRARRSTDTGPTFLYGDSDTPPQLVAFHDTLRIRRTHPRLSPRALTGIWKKWNDAIGGKGRDLTQSCDKNPYTNRTIQKATWQHKNTTKNVDYTTIADRLRTVSWSNSSQTTGVVKPVYERSTFPLTATAVAITFQLLNYFVWLRITDEGSLPENAHMVHIVN